MYWSESEIKYAAVMIGLDVDQIRRLVGRLPRRLSSPVASGAKHRPGFYPERVEVIDGLPSDSVN